MFSQDIAERICAGLAEGKSLRAVCAVEGVAPSTVLEWLPSHEAFAEQYARARETGYALLADELVEIADDGRRDSFVDDEGVLRTNHEVVARAKLRVDTRKWMLSKMLPKVYGDKLDMTVEDITDRAGQMRERREKRLASRSAR